MNKCLEDIKLHLDEDLKRDIQDYAMQDDRKVSEWLRHEIKAVVRLRKAGVIISNTLDKSRGEA
jgi:hypothetical protein